MADLTPLDLAAVTPADFAIATFDDELRVDQLAVRLLLAVRDALLAAGGRTPLEVGRLCQDADLFLRDFVIAACGDNLLELPPGRVRQFGGHWYMLNVLELKEERLTAILAGIAACYEVLAARGLVTPAVHAEVAKSCADLDWYRRRLSDFWAIEGDGYLSWRAACPLPEPRW